MARTNQTVQQTEGFDLSIVNVETALAVTAKKTASLAVDNDVRSLGSIFSSIRRNRAETSAAIEEAVKSGRKLDREALHEMLNVGNFNLFRHFLTENEREKSKFTGSQGYNILFRAASMQKKHKEAREAFFAAQ